MIEFIKMMGFLSWCIGLGLLAFAAGLLAGMISWWYLIGWSTIIK